MGKPNNRLLVSLAVVVISILLLQILTPVIASETTTSEKQAKPWPYAMPNNISLPYLSSIPKDQKVDPRIIEKIKSGASEVQVIIYYDWNYQYNLLINLPPGSKLLPFATEVIKYLPFLGVSLPADLNEIEKLGKLPYIRWIAYNKELDADKMLQYLKPEEEAKLLKLEQIPYGNPNFATLMDVAIETKVTELWKMGITGKGVIIGIMDTGINPRHPDFFFPDGRSKIIFSFSPFSGEDAYQTRPNLYSAHGTHVASIAAASGIGEGLGWYLDRTDFYYKRAYISRGFSTGMAPDAYLAIFKIFSDPVVTGEPATVYHIVISIVQAVKVGVDVMNASWGFIGFDAFTQGILYLAVAWAIQNGMVWVNSAGNYGPQLVSSGWPAQHESVITVGVTYPENFITAGFGQKVVYWSSRGPTYPSNSFFQNGADIIPTKGPLSAGRVKPDVLAPGFGIMAANGGFEYPSIYESWDAFNPPPEATINVGTMYKTLSGTSMSAPVVTGIVALLLSAFPGATPAAIKAALINGATKTTTLNGQDDPNIVGAGIVNALESYNILKNSPKKEGFKIPYPYWQFEDIAANNSYKQIFNGYKILVDDIVSTSNITPKPGRFAVPTLATFDYTNFISDLKRRGANVSYMSDWFPAQLVYVRQDVVIESEHPYPALTDRFWHIYHPGARGITVHFEYISLGASPNNPPLSPPTNAILLVYSWDWFSVAIFVPPPNFVSDVAVTFTNTPGVHIRLITDNSTGDGFKVDYYIAHMPKPQDITYNIRRAVSNNYYWSQEWETNVAESDPLIIGLYQDVSTEPWYRNEYNIFTITYDNLVEWYKIMQTISLCYWPYIPQGNFTLYDLWFPIPSFSLNFTSGFDPAVTPLSTAINLAKAGSTPSADILYVNGTAYDPDTETYENTYFRIEVYAPYYRDGTPAVVTNPVQLAQNTVPALLFGQPPLYTAEYLTGIDSWKWLRVIPPPNKYIFVNATHPLKFWFITNGDGKGGAGLETTFIALGSNSIHPPMPTDYSKFETVILSAVVNSPKAEFFGAFDLVMILTPWYVDPDWIDSFELKNYVDKYIGRVLFVGGHIHKQIFGGTFGFYWDEPIYMLPRGSEVGTPVKMNYYTWPFGIEWVGSVAGGTGRIVADNPVFGPWIDKQGNSQPMRIYFGHELMSIKLRDNVNKSVWVYDPVYPGIVFWNSTLCNGALFISDAFILSDISYGLDSALPFPEHSWFGLRAVAYLLDPHPPYRLIDQVNKWYYAIGGPTFEYGLKISIWFSKIVNNGTIWTLNYTLTNTLDYAVEVNVTVEYPNNSTIAGILATTGLNTSWYHTVIPAGSSVSFALGGIAYTKPSVFAHAGISYYPVYSSHWNTFRFDTFVYANFTQSGNLGTDPVWQYKGRSVSILNKPLAREGALPLVYAVHPSSYDSYTANLIAKYPLDWKYVNVTYIVSDPSITELTAEITGDAKLVADFGILVNETWGEPTPQVWRVVLKLVGDKITLRPENVSYVAGSALESYMPPPELIGVPVLVPIADGHYPGLPSTGHFFAFVYVLIDPNLSSGRYSGTVDAKVDNNVLASMNIDIIVETRPNGYIVWDDGLYLNNRPAVDDPGNYNGIGVAVFTDHTWGTLPWIVMFDFWKEMTFPPLNFAVKPSAAISIILDAIAENQSANIPPWRHEAFFKDLVTRTFANASGFLLLDNQHFDPFNGLYFSREVSYAPEQRFVSYTARDIMVSILSNGGTLIVFAEYGSANSVRPTGTANPYNMNWVLSYVGSRVYFPTGVNTSAKRDAMPLAHGTPTGERPLLAGWTRFTPQYLPYATLNSYYYFGYLYGLLNDLEWNMTNEKLFLDVNRLNLDDVSTYSKYVLPRVIETPSPYPPLTTYLYEIEVPNADYVIVAFDYIIATEGAIIQVLDSNLNPVWTYNVAIDTEEYGILSSPVKGVGGSTKLYVKFASGPAVKPGFDKGIKISYVLYASTAAEDELVQFYVINEYDTPYTWTTYGVNKTWQSGRYRVASWNALAGKHGMALVLDTKLTGIISQYGYVPLPKAKVIAFGQAAWFDSWYWQHSVGFVDYHIFGAISRHVVNLRIFIASVLQYAAGYYEAVKTGAGALTSFIQYLKTIVDEATAAGMTVTDVQTLIAQAEAKLSEVSSLTKLGDYIGASVPLREANSTAWNAANSLLDQLESQVNAIRNSAINAINDVKSFIEFAKSSGIDVSEAISMLNNAISKFNSTDESYNKYSRGLIETWISLVSIYKDYRASSSLAIQAHNTAGSLVFNAADAERRFAFDAYNKAKDAIQTYRNAGYAEKATTLATFNSAISLYNEGLNELNKYVAGDTTTYRYPINAISKFKQAYELALKAYQLLLADAKENAASQLASARARIETARATPNINRAALADQESILATLEAKFATAQTLDDFISIAKQAASVDSNVKKLIEEAIITTPTPTPFPLFQLIIIVILLILLIFLIVYAAVRRRKT